ncbi:MAG: acylphosphatase [Candidatus Thermoplasmatota archaeon]|jgi:acylphosphatase|nr:acylphosphatase [Candidatus Thermoplasmatota archaeon]
MDIRAHVFISGRVQGVFYRASTKNMAEQLGLKGWVRNTSDGRVEALFEGDETAVKDMISWCHKGPRSAEVSDVTVDYTKFLGEFEEFCITY